MNRLALAGADRRCLSVQPLLAKAFENRFSIAVGRDTEHDDQG